MTSLSEQKQDKIKGVILFVDDEKNILSSLTRLFRPVIEKILTAESGAEGLKILEEESVDIIVSDMRMPQMDGAEFLEKVTEKWPETIRILLTGYADITSTINAINKGNIYRYISKPWEDNDIILSVRQALEQKQIKEERDNLLLLTSQQNEELKDLNTNLEEKVKARTEEVQQTMEQLEITYDTLKNNYDKTINVISNIIELREGVDSNDNSNIPDLAVRLAKKIELSEEQVKNIYFAALLRNIGRIGFPDSLNRKPFDSLSKDEMNSIRQHPVIGQGVLMALDYLQDAANIIRSQYERYDGQGYPDSLSAESIPVGARILRLVSDYFLYQKGLISSKILSETETRDSINRKRDMRYDPELVDAFFEILDAPDTVESKEEVINEKMIKSTELLEGMELARDLTIKNGVVLLTKGHILTPKFIRAIHKMERTMKEEIMIYILLKDGADSNV